MAAATNTAESTWRNWTASDWNRALFLHFFKGTEDTSAVSRITINDSMLVRVAGDTESAGELLDAFRSAVCDALRGENLAHAIERIGRENRGPDTIPEEFVYLAVTCYVATCAIESGREGNFRRRLREFLKLDATDYNYPLNSLPRGWRRLQSWLENAIEDGYQYRRLILQPPSRQIIGYSVDLAFPSHRDHLKMVECLAPHRLSTLPPVVSILQIIDSKQNLFSEKFRSAFRDFRSAFESRQPNLDEFPFWSAACEAIREGDLGYESTGPRIPRATLRLDREVDWHFDISVYLDREPSPPMVAIPAGDHAVGVFSWVLTTVEQESMAPAEWVIGGHAHESLLKQEPAIRRAVDSGLLLFEPNDEDVWTLKTTCTNASRLRALIRRDLIERDAAVGDALRSCGARLCNSQYSEWLEIDSLSLKGTGSHLLATLFPESDAFQLSVNTPSVHPVGGVRTSAGWLGWRSCLPELTSAASAVKVTASSPTTSNEVTCQRSETSGNYRFPWPPQFPQNLDGECVLRVRRDDSVICSRIVHFESRVLSCEYRGIPNESSWLSEGGTVDAGPLNSDSQIPDEVGDASLGEGDLILSHSPRGYYCDNNEEVIGLTEILAGSSLRRGVLDASRLIRWFQEALDLAKPSDVWNAIRSWVEAGSIDQLIHANWRCTAYRARKPRFVVTKALGKLPIRAVLQGLAPLSVEEAIRRAAEHTGSRIERMQSVSRYVSSPLILFAPDMESVKSIARDSGIGSTEILRPVNECVASVTSLTFHQTALRMNHVPHGEWLWDKQIFTSSTHSSAPGVKRYRRHDSPDSYLIHIDGSQSIHTHSKTWAILIDAAAHGHTVYETRPGLTCIHMRPGVYLPIAVGRWATVTSGKCPCATEEGEYLYHFACTAHAEKVIKSLWRSSVSDGLRRRIQHLALMLQADHSRAHLAPVPPRVFVELERHGLNLACPDMLRTKRIPRRLLPQLLSIHHALAASTGRGVKRR